MFIERYENSILVDGSGQHRIIVRTGHIEFRQPGYIVTLIRQRAGDIRIEHLVKQKPQ